jgi:hypothetical protein
VYEKNKEVDNSYVRNRQEIENKMCTKSNIANPDNFHIDPDKTIHFNTAPEPVLLYSPKAWSYLAGTSLVFVLALYFCIV